MEGKQYFSKIGNRLLKYASEQEESFTALLTFLAKTGRLKRVIIKCWNFIAKSEFHYHSQNENDPQLDKIDYRIESSDSYQK